MPTCENCCVRPGKRVLQYAHGPCGRYGEVPRFVFRHYLCPFCLGAHKAAREKGRASAAEVHHVQNGPRNFARN